MEHTTISFYSFQWNKSNNIHFTYLNTKCEVRANSPKNVCLNRRNIKALTQKHKQRYRNQKEPDYRLKRIDLIEAPSWSTSLEYSDCYGNISLSVRKFVGGS